MSQFSAAVADTAGGGGLLSDLTRNRLRTRWSYALVAVAALVLNWVADIFDIIAVASRAFALYYALQCASAFAVNRSVRHRAAFATLAVLLSLVVVFAVPVA